MNIYVFGESDRNGLEVLLQEYRPFLHSEVEQMAVLRQRLDEAVIVPDDRLSASIAALDDDVELLDASDRSHRRYRLVLPVDADGARERLSILSPLGGAVLGLTEGSIVDVETRADSDRIVATFVLMRVTKERRSRHPEGMGLHNEHSNNQGRSL